MGYKIQVVSGKAWWTYTLMRERGHTKDSWQSTGLTVILQGERDDVHARVCIAQELEELSQSVLCNPVAVPFDCLLTIPQKET